MESKQKNARAFWLWALFGTAAALLTVAFLVGMNGGAQPTAQEKQTVSENCQLVQTIHYTRCGHEVTRRIAAD